MSRYLTSHFLNTSQGKRYYGTMLYPQITPKPTDIYVITVKGDRLDNLAYEYYKDENLWWIIAISNEIKQDSLYIMPGTQIRIPVDISSIINDFEILNKSR